MTIIKNFNSGLHILVSFAENFDHVFRGYNENAKEKEKQVSEAYHETKQFTQKRIKVQ